MIPIREISGAIHPAKSRARRIFLIFRFYCDESHDAPIGKKTECRSYVVGGIFGDESSWSQVEKGWARKNKLEGVARFHATELNAADGEFEGWSKARRVAYSKEMLAIMKKPGKKLHAVSVGLYVDEYRRLISLDGQAKMGEPWFVCFKSALMAVASGMDRRGAEFRPEDQFTMIIDQNELDAKAIEIFYTLKQNPNFKHRHRLAACTAGSAEEFIGLQAADFIAYESFRLMHGRRSCADLDMRAPLKAILGKIGMLGMAFGTETLTRIKDDIETMPSLDNGLFIIPPYIYPENKGA